MYRHLLMCFLKDILVRPVDNDLEELKNLKYYPHLKQITVFCRATPQSLLKVKKLKSFGMSFTVMHVVIYIA